LPKPNIFPSGNKSCSWVPDGKLLLSVGGSEHREAKSSSSDPTEACAGMPRPGKHRPALCLGPGLPALLHAGWSQGAAPLHTLLGSRTALVFTLSLFPAREQSFTSSLHPGLPKAPCPQAPPPCCHRIFRAHRWTAPSSSVQTACPVTYASSSASPRNMHALKTSFPA
jgi:hypothetical protein